MRSFKNLFCKSSYDGCILFGRIKKKYGKKLFFSINPPLQRQLTGSHVDWLICCPCFTRADKRIGSGYCSGDLRGDTALVKRVAWFPGKLGLLFVWTRTGCELPSPGGASLAGQGCKKLFRDGERPSFVSRRSSFRMATQSEGKELVWQKHRPKKKIPHFFYF